MKGYSEIEGENVGLGLRLKSSLVYLMKLQDEWI